jgi:tripartite-type tricarboxylate transporter receptor subunit TctC
MRRILPAAIVLAALAFPPAANQAAANQAAANDVASFFGGRTVTIYVGYSAGGGYDRYSRTLARHIGRHIPGNPAVTVENRPGAGSLKLANRLFSEENQDGTSIGTIGRAAPTEPLFGNSQAKFDPRRFQWLGSMNNEVSVCVAWHKAPLYFWADLKSRGALMGGTGAGSDTDLFPTVLNNVLGTKIKLVTGFPTGFDINLAMEQGVIEGRCGWSWSSIRATRKNLVSEKKIRILLQLAVARHKDLPNVPAAAEFAATRKDRETLNLFLSRQLWARPYLVGPNVPKIRADALRAAFEKTMADSAFREDSGRQWLQTGLVDAATIRNQLETLYAYPLDVVSAAVRARIDRSRTQIFKAIIKVDTDRGEIATLARGNRVLTWKSVAPTLAADKGDYPKKSGTLRIAAGRTRIMIDGKSADPSALKTGMKCSFIYEATLAKKIECVPSGFDLLDLPDILGR